MLIDERQSHVGVYGNVRLPDLGLSLQTLCDSAN